MKPARVLIIDDDAMLGEQLRSLLAVLGHSGTFCADAVRARQMLDEKPFDLIFCDYWMPMPDGRSLFQSLVREAPDAAAKVVLLTGGVLGDETQFFIRSQGNLQLVKPFKLMAVKQVLAAIWEQAEPSIA